MENVVLILCLAGLGSIMFGRALERTAKFLKYVAGLVGHITEAFAAVAVILVLVSSVALGHKRTAEATDSLANVVRHVVAAVHVPGR